MTTELKRDGHRWNARKVMQDGRLCLDCGRAISLFSKNPRCEGGNK